MNTLFSWFHHMFVCVDCQHITFTGWKCRECSKRLCFGCTGGWFMDHGYSPGFEMCQSCKDVHAEQTKTCFPLRIKGVVSMKKEQ